MQSPRESIKSALLKTDYFKNNLEHLLRYLYPTFHCLKLIVKVLLHGPDGSGKRMLAQLAAENLNTQFCEEHVTDMFDDNIVGTERKVRTALSKYSSLAPCLIYFTGYELFSYLEEPDLDRIEYAIKETLAELSAASAQPIIFIAATNDFHRVYKTPLSEIFQHDIQLRSPTLEQAKELLQSIALNIELRSNPLELVGSSTNAGEYYIGNLLHLATKSEVNYHKKTFNIHERSLGEQELSNFRCADTRWVDVGGLGHIKNEIINAIQLSVDYPQLEKSGLRRKGILLYGPPGTGKTLLAKAVATECSLGFINIKGPELLSEYVGQSEDNVRKLFQKARDSSPSVIFFDEIDSLAPNRGQAGDSGGVMDRMVSQLLAEMDGVEKSDGVFVIGATNRVDLVDPSLLRPGRFDKVLEVPLPTSRESRLQILKALTRKMPLEDNVDLGIIESMAPPNMSGADFKGLCTRARFVTLNRCLTLVESGKICEDEVEVVTNMGDFLEILH